jgi:hypothetical protein
MLMRDYEESP